MTRHDRNTIIYAVTVTVFLGFFLVAWLLGW